MRGTFPAAVLLCLICVAAAAADEQTAQARLARAGLVPVGRHWMTGEEVELRNQLEQVGRLERGFFTARDKFTETVRKYRSCRSQLEQFQAALDKNAGLIKQTSTSALQRQQLEGESRQYAEAMARLRKQIDTQLNVLDEQSPATQAAVDLVNARNALAVALLSVERLLRRLDRRTSELASDTALTATIEEAGPQHSLGPAEDYATVHRRTLQRLARAVLTDGVPVYRRSGQFRLSLIVAEQTAATFSYVGARGPTLIPASLLPSAGIALDESAPTETIEADGRTLAVRRVRIPMLRVGQFVVRDVEALVLPPEAEDLGAQISMEAFGSYHAQLEPDRLWFRLVEP